MVGYLDGWQLILFNVVNSAEALIASSSSSLAVLDEVMRTAIGIRHSVNKVVHREHKMRQRLLVNEVGVADFSGVKLLNRKLSQLVCLLEALALAVVAVSLKQGNEEVVLWQIVHFLLLE